MSLLATRFLIIDTETTGLDPTVDRVVEISTIPAQGSKSYKGFATRINPLRPIPPETSAVHGIADWDVEDKPTFDQVWPFVKKQIESADVLVAHNAPFDRSFLPETEKPWLDTKRLAQHLWPDAPNFKNQTLRYWKRLKIQAAAHSADGDTLVTAYLLILLIRDYLERGHQDDAQSLIEFSQRPIVVAKMPFGKHRGVLLEEVPDDYLRWAIKNVEDMDSDLRYSIGNRLKRLVISP